MLTDTEKAEICKIARRRGHARHKRPGCMKLPQGCTCDRRPYLTYAEINDEWNQWYLDNNYGSEIPVEFSDSD